MSKSDKSELDFMRKRGILQGAMPNKLKKAYEGVEIAKGDRDSAKGKYESAMQIINAVATDNWTPYAREIIIRAIHTIPTLLDALEEAYAQNEEISGAFGELADGLFTAHKAKEYMAEHDHWKARAEAMERIIASVGNDFPCDYCKGDEGETPCYSDGYTCFKFDAARFTGDAP